mmetsp:Transcript_27015/g.47695  ORF Transcript_27015/g.47695 Transcript_27015/m.47695 type:complete len:422 (-) Transcript_27015:1004-2269(-)
MDPNCSEAEKQATRLTCDALCSLSNASVVGSPAATASAPGNIADAPGGMCGQSAPSRQQVAETVASSGTIGVHGLPYAEQGDEASACASVSSSIQNNTSNNNNNQRKTKPPAMACSKQHQLPMFLSKTYHMIDRCDPEIATWSATGDNFVVKNVDKFSNEVLPLYFKHSNFSSFARQLNFYGFRKLRSDPILTNDVDPNTASYVRFYHEKFQKDRPELLSQIKRATKSDQQSKDDVDGLKSEVVKLKVCIQTMQSEMNRKLADMSYEYNSRISNLSSEYDKLAGLVTQMMQQHQQLQTQQHHHHVQGPPSVVETSIRSTAQMTSSTSALTPEYKMHSLSQVVAMRLQQHSAGSATVTTSSQGAEVSISSSTTTKGDPEKQPQAPQQAAAHLTALSGTKRPASEDLGFEEGTPLTCRPKTTS